jgi:hypothetical protein
MMTTVWILAIVSSILAIDFINWMWRDRVDWPNVPNAIFWILTAAISWGVIAAGGWTEYVALWSGN